MSDSLTADVAEARVRLGLVLDLVLDPLPAPLPGPLQIPALPQRGGLCVLTGAGMSAAAAFVQRRPTLAMSHWPTLRGATPVS